jgi:hypothetical protein
MILTDLRKVIDRNFENETFMDAMRYSQGYLDGVFHAPRYGTLSRADWHKLNSYIQDKCKEKLDIECSTERIMEKIKGGNNG